MTDYVQVPYHRFVAVTMPAMVVGPPVVVNLPIPNSQYYTQFLFQIKGFLAGVATVSLQGSLDGINWAPLSADSYLHPQPFTADANGLVFSVDTYGVFKGGLRFAISNNTDAGSIFVSMLDSPINAGRV